MRTNCDAYAVVGAGETWVKATTLFSTCSPAIRGRRPVHNEVEQSKCENKEERAVNSSLGGGGWGGVGRTGAETSAKNIYKARAF